MEMNSKEIQVQVEQYC